MTTLGLAASVTHLSILAILHFWIGQSIANGNTLHGDVDTSASLVALPNAVRYGRDIVACIRLTKNEEVQFLEAREICEECLEENHHVFCNSFFIAD